MPELPEVETTVREIRKYILGRKIKDVWSDVPKILKQPGSFREFKKKIINKKIEKVWRRAKNIIIDLSDDQSLLIHQKMTGHLLMGRWKKMRGVWQSMIKGPLEDSVNKYLHLIFYFDDGIMMALSDMRKFAKVELWDSAQLRKSAWIKNLGPEPLEENFSLKKFKEVIEKKKGKIKQVLMDQAVISGIGNIYSDEILWQAKINPQRSVATLSQGELKIIYKEIKKILSLAIRLHGESFSDYRRPSGIKGNFDPARKVYRRTGEKCPRCGFIIERIKIGGRSAHFCPHCQK